MDDEPVLTRYLAEQSRASILHILAESPDESYTTSELADLAGLDTSTVSKTWEDLVEDDLVEVADSGEGPREFQLAENDATAALSEFVAELVAWDAERVAEDRDRLSGFKQ